MMGTMVKGSIRKGISLLSGLLRCGICGRKFGVGYSGTSGKVIRYTCRGHFMKEGIEKCQTLGGLKIEEAVSKAVLEVLSPHGIRASVNAIKAQAEKGKEKIRQIELSLTEAKYKAERAKRQYNKVEQGNAPRFRRDSSKHSVNPYISIFSVFRIKLGMKTTDAPGNSRRCAQIFGNIAQQSCKQKRILKFYIFIILLLIFQSEMGSC